MRVSPKQVEERKGLQSNNTTGYRGVNYHIKSGKYRARVKHNGIRTELGEFDTAEQANIAATAARRVLFSSPKELTVNYTHFTGEPTFHL
jgi:hypothetical protein